MSGASDSESSEDEEGGLPIIEDPGSSDEEEGALPIVEDPESSEEENYEEEEEEEDLPIDEDDLPFYDTDNRHSYLYHDTGPVTFSNELHGPHEDGYELKEILTTFHSFPLCIGDEVPFLKLDENDNRIIKTVIEEKSYMVSINCGESDPYAVASWLRDRSDANETSLFPMIDAVVMEVISHATKEENNSEKTIGVCRVVGRIRVERVEKRLTGLIYSHGVAKFPSTLQSYELSTLSRVELALPREKKLSCLRRLLAYNSRLIMQHATSSSIDRLFSIMKWIPDDVIAKVKEKQQWKVVTFLIRALPLDRRIHHILNRVNSTDAQISILDSIDYSTISGSCIVCQHELFKTSDLVYTKPWVSSAVFVNPAEYMFDTLILRHTIAPSFGALDESFSWFSGYGWRHLMCWDGCRTHLGWRFESKSVRPTKFCALQRGRFRVMSEEIKVILAQYDCDGIHPTRFFNRVTVAE